MTTLSVLVLLQIRPHLTPHFQAPITPSLNKRDNSSWISFLDDVVEDAEKDILLTPMEDEEEPDIQPVSTSALPVLVRL